MTEFLEVTSFDPLLVSATGKTVSSISIDGTNHLIFHYSDGSQLDAGLLPTGGGGGGSVNSVLNGDTTITVDNTDPTNPKIKVTAGTFDAAGAAGSAQAFAIQRGNHTGTQSADTITDGSTNKAYTATEKTKLAALNAGTTSGTYAAGDDSRITGAQAKSTLTTKGDTYVATASGVTARQPVGTDGQIEVADSTATNGKSWVGQISDLPPYAQSLKLTHRWDAQQCAYNNGPVNLHPLTEKMAQCSQGVRQLNLLTVGDSTLIGYDGAAYHLDQAIPRVIGRTGARMLGGVDVISGFRFLGVDNAGNHDDTVTIAGGWSVSYPLLTNLGGTGDATWKSLDAGTQVQFVIDNNSAAGLTWDVDGVAQTPVVIGGGGSGTNGFTLVTSNTTLANKQHTVTFHGISTKNYYIYAARVYTPGFTGIVVHNLNIGGSRSNSGVHNQNWSNVTSTFGAAGLGYMAQGVITAWGGTIDAVINCVGNNDASAGIDAPTILAGLDTMHSFWSTVPWCLVHPPKVTGTLDTIFDPLTQGFYTKADSLGAVLVDWNWYAQMIAGFLADGADGADLAHPTASEQRRIGSLIARALFITTGPAAGIGSTAPPAFSSAGNLAVKTGAFVWINNTGRTQTITGISAKLGTAATGASVNLDIKISGVTAYPTTTKPSIAAGSTAVVNASLPDLTKVGPGETISVDITQVGSGTTGADLSVCFAMAGA